MAEAAPGAICSDPSGLQQKAKASIKSRGWETALLCFQSSTTHLKTDFYFWCQYVWSISYTASKGTSLAFKNLSWVSKDVTKLAPDWIWLRLDVRKNHLCKSLCEMRVIMWDAMNRNKEDVVFIADKEKRKENKAKHQQWTLGGNHKHSDIMSKAHLCCWSHLRKWVPEKEQHDWWALASLRKNCIGFCMR